MKECKRHKWARIKPGRGLRYLHPNIKAWKQCLKCLCIEELKVKKN